MAAASYYPVSSMLLDCAHTVNSHIVVETFLVSAEDRIWPLFPLSSLCFTHIYFYHILVRSLLVVVYA